MAEPSHRSAFFRLHQFWTRTETRIVAWVIIAEVLDLVLSVLLRGLAADYRTGSTIGVLCRAIIGAVALGIAAYWLTRKQNPKVAAAAAFGGILLGALLGRLLADAGSSWASNVQGWLQNASTLSLIGGPRGLATRLTLLVALLGGSLAAGAGKHINIDVVSRHLPNKLVKPTAILGMALSALVCVAASYGFTDSIAVTKYRADAFHNCADGKGRCDTAFGYRMGVVAHGISSDFFLFRRQLVLDLASCSKVLVGVRYDTYLTATEWNEFIDQGDWSAHFVPSAVRGLKMPSDDPTATKMPAVVAPDTGEGRDLLIRDFDFVLPFGLLMIACKFLLRLVLVVKGEIQLDASDGTHEGAPKDMIA